MFQSFEILENLSKHFGSLTFQVLELVYVNGSFGTFFLEFRNEKLVVDAGHVDVPRLKI